MTFGEAINECKNGAKISRTGWNGKEQYVELARNISYLNSEGELINVCHDAIGNMAFAFVGTSGVQIGWLASQADMLANDWEIHKSQNKEEEYLNCIFKVVNVHGDGEAPLMEVGKFYQVIDGRFSVDDDAPFPLGKELKTVQDLVDYLDMNKKYHDAFLQCLTYKIEIL